MGKRRRMYGGAVDDWSDAHREQLISGQCFLPEGFDRDPDDRHSPDREQAKAAWADLADEINAQFAVDHPGRRCWGWWTFSSPGRRRLRHGQPDLVHPDHRDALTFGRPRCFTAVVTPEDIGTLYESEADFLRRYDLLTDFEKLELGSVGR